MTTIQVPKTDVEVWYVGNPSLDLSQLAVEVIKTVPGTVALQTTQVAVEVVRQPSNIEVELSQFCIELLRPVAGYAKLTASLFAVASIAADLEVAVIPPEEVCDPCEPFPFTLLVKPGRLSTEEDNCSVGDCPPEGYRSQ